MSETSGERCSFDSQWGRCQQSAGSDGLCSYHHHMQLDPEFRVDAFYHRKIVIGIITPSWDHLSDAEAETLLHGHRRGDGRRLDLWVVDQPIAEEAA